MDKKSEKMVINAYFGDGHLLKQSKNANYSLSFCSVSFDLLVYKYNMCRKLTPKWVKDRVSGYGGIKPIKAFGTRVNKDIVKYIEKGFDFILSRFEMLDLILLYLDDGSVHKRHGTVHLYTNSFNLEETEKIMERIDTLLKADEKHKCRRRVDKKKDGRAFNYIYIPRILAEYLIFETENFLNKYDIESLRYKIFYYADTLNDHRKAMYISNEKKPRLEIGKYTLEPSRVGLKTRSGKAGISFKPV